MFALLVGRLETPLVDQLVDYVAGLLACIQAVDPVLKLVGIGRLLRFQTGSGQDLANLCFHAATGLSGAQTQAIAHFVGQVADGQYGHGRVLQGNFLAR